MNAQTSVVNAAKWRFEKRADSSPLRQFAAVVIAVAGALLISSLLIHAAGANVGIALRAMAQGAFAGKNALETLVQAIPLIFTGLAATVAFRGQVWNIGAEGQLFAGAMLAFWMSATLGPLSPAVLIPTVLLGAALGGALWGVIPGLLKVRFGADEIIVTVMFNYIIKYLLSLLLSGPWQDPASFYQQTVKLTENARLPLLIEGSRLHGGLILALLMAVAVYVLISRTPLGYEIRALGYNATAARYKGIKVSRLVVVIMAISGAIAGLAGGTELFGVAVRLKPDLSAGLGYTGIIVALLGRLHPLGVIAASVLFGALVTGCSAMQIQTGVPAALAYAIQGIVLIFVLSADILARYRIRRSPCGQMS